RRRHTRSKRDWSSDVCSSDLYNERYKGGFKMLELIDLSKRYKDQYAVKSMNMYIEKGEIIGLLGPNGAGKSTTISMLSTLIEPTEGDVIFKKKSILKNPSPLRKVT